ncbi:hypothetical protein ONS96_013358 [Cadophora gregata f. sp. sojae]|nr:hypothetical protein ONS96_013358 [Cadophora gregata f. sp. sojae]
MARPLASPDHYAILEVSPTAPHPLIKENYRRLALKYHPDKNRDDLDRATRRFQELSRAWEVLGDVRRRTEYDVLRERRGGNERWWERGFSPWGSGSFTPGTSGRSWRTGRGSGDAAEDEEDLIEKARRRREDIDREASARFRRESRSSEVSEEEEEKARVADEAIRKSRAVIWKAVACQEYRQRLRVWMEYRDRNSVVLTQIAETKRALKKAETELGNQNNETEAYVEGVFRDAIRRSRTTGALPDDHDSVVLEKLFEARRAYILRLTQNIEQNQNKLRNLTRELNWDGRSYEAAEYGSRQDRVQEALEILGPRDLNTPLFCILNRRGLAINRWNVLGRVKEASKSAIPAPSEGPWHDPGDWQRVRGEHDCGRCDQKAFHFIAECGPAMCPGCGMVVCNDCYRDLKLLQEYERWILSDDVQARESLFSLDFDSAAGDWN